MEKLILLSNDDGIDAKGIKVLEEALEGLSLNHRLVIMLFYMGDFNLQEIGYILDCPVGTVKSRLHYARLRLREVISEEEIRPLVEALQSVGG